MECTDKAINRQRDWLSNNDFLGKDSAWLLHDGSRLTQRCAVLLTRHTSGDLFG